MVVRGWGGVEGGGENKIDISPFFDASRNKNICATIRIGQEIRSLPCVGFLGHICYSTEIHDNIEQLSIDKDKKKKKNQHTLDLDLLELKFIFLYILEVQGLPPIAMGVKVLLQAAKIPLSSTSLHL